MLPEVRALLPRFRVRILQRNACLVLPFLTVVFFFMCSPLQLYRSSHQFLTPESRPRNRSAMPSIERKFEAKLERGLQRNFTIHIWRHGDRMKRRFLRSYGAVERDPYAGCSVRNCKLTTDDALVGDSDAVFFHLHQTKGPQSLPRHRKALQLWIFFTDESPLHTFLLSKKYSMRHYDELFNWSMTYRSDSDIPVPYGRTVPLSAAEKAVLRPKKSFAKSKTRGIAILGSNCGGQNHRWDYVRELQRHVDVDVYGGCGNRTCPGHFTRDCAIISDYKFYLAFENSNCREYLTEKLWWNAYAKETVPVVMGAPKSDYERLCPPGSFLHVDDFESPAQLAARLDSLMRDDDAYNDFFNWKSDFKVVNEHGYFGSPSAHLCRMCEALNRVGSARPRTYEDLESFWSPKTDCFSAHWPPTN